MSIVVPKYKLNRWDKDSIRPGPVGSVGDVNLQVKLKKSSIDQPERYDPTFSGKNEPWSGSNISDGMWYGWTSGGRGGMVVSKALPNIQTGGKTAVGWTMQNIVAADRSRETKMTPLGRYGWDTTVGSVLKSKHTGELFLPLPDGYQKTDQPRGSQNPRVVAESMGDGIVLPATDVPITDPVFGDTGTIEVPGREVPGSCPADAIKKNWAPAMDDPEREKKEHLHHKDYIYRYATFNTTTGRDEYDLDEYPEVGDNVLTWHIGQNKFVLRNFSPCGLTERPKEIPPYNPPTKIPSRKLPMPGNQDKRRQDRKKEQEDEKKKKQKLR